MKSCPLINIYEVLLEKNIKMFYEGKNIAYIFVLYVD